MTDTCAACEFRKLCEDLGYPMECTDVDECENYDPFMDGKWQAEEVLGEIDC